MKLNVNTEGIVIKRKNYKDSDKIVTLITKDFGKIDTLAKSIRSSKSKKQSHLDLLNKINAQIIEGKYWYIIGQTDLLATNKNLKKDYDSINKAYFICEVIDMITPENEINHPYYDFVDKSLETLAIEPSYKIVNAFILKVLNISGFLNFKKIIIKDPSIKEYFRILLNSKYSQILESNFNIEMEINSTRLLIMQLEKTIEHKIRTNIID